MTHHLQLLSQYYPFSEQIIRMAAPNTVVRNGPIVYKRIRVISSDSDDAPTPPKKPAVAEITNEMKERRFKNMREMFPDLPPAVSSFMEYRYSMIV